MKNGLKLLAISLLTTSSADAYINDIKVEGNQINVNQSNVDLSFHLEKDYKFKLFRFDQDGKLLKSIEKELNKQKEGNAPFNLIDHGFGDGYYRGSLDIDLKNSVSEDKKLYVSLGTDFNSFFVKNITYYYSDFIEVSGSKTTAIGNLVDVPFVNNIFDRDSNSFTGKESLVDFVNGSNDSERYHFGAICRNPYLDFGFSLSLFDNKVSDNKIVNIAVSKDFGYLGIFDDINVSGGILFSEKDKNKDPESVWGYAIRGKTGLFDFPLTTQVYSVGTFESKAKAAGSGRQSQSKEIDSRKILTNGAELSFDDLFNKSLLVKLGYQNIIALNKDNAFKSISNIVNLDFKIKPLDELGILVKFAYDRLSEREDNEVVNAFSGSLGLEVNF